jgi:DNA processing protein
MLGVSAAGPLAAAGAVEGEVAVATEGGRRAHADAGVLVDPYAAEREAWTILSASHGLGPLGFAALLACFGTGRRILEVAHGPDPVRRLMETPLMHPGERDRERPPIGHAIAQSIVDTADRGAAIVGRVRRLGVRVITVEEPTYPERLAMIAMPPHVLFVTGDVAALSMDRAVAVVGTRRATSSGRTTAGRIATALVAADAAVISGLAFGIDGAAHEATVRAGGRTVAVIGGGHAVIAPRAHARLGAAIIAAGGAIVSELAPDVEPSRGTFPRRNRIISGLADATVVIEAPARSGALITASWALEQGRDCYLVPGGLDAPASAGCLSFLREFADARIVAGVPQLISDLGLSRPAGEARDALSAATSQGLGVTESAIAAALVAGRVTVDELVATTDLPVATVLAALTMLERRGLAAGVHGRYRPAGTLLGEPPRIVLR